MRNIEEYNFSDLLDDISGYRLERWNKTTTASGFDRYCSVDDFKPMALMDVVEVKSDKKVDDCTIGIIVNRLDGGRVQICLTFRSEYVPRKRGFRGDKAKYRQRMSFLFSRLKCGGWVSFSLVEDGRCWLSVPRVHAAEVPDLLWEIYKNVLMYPCECAYDAVGTARDPVADSLPDLSFSELDSV